MNIKITDSDITIGNLLSIEDLNGETKNRIQNSDILLVPFHKFRGNEGRVFNSETSDFYKYAKNNLNELTISICENRGQEKTFRLHSAQILLPTILINIDPLKDIILRKLLCAFVAP